MIRRAVVLPAEPDRVWEALTDPGLMEGWLGARVDWDLRPGSPARFHGGDGGERSGVVAEVVPARRLRFLWWPDTDTAEVSEVTWEVDDADDGTRLTVTERPATAPATVSAAPQACAGSAWSRHDDAALRAWAGSARALVAVG